jgi:hypothetical protein
MIMMIIIIITIIKTHFRMPHLLALMMSLTQDFGSLHA